MTRAREIADLVMPWTGLMTGVIALAIAHQFGSDGTFDHCRTISPIPLLIVCLLAIASMLGGAFASWTVFRNEAEASERKVIAAISIGSSALFILAITLPIIAALVIPPCFQ